MHEFTDPAARELIAHVLDTHPDGQSLVTEAGHRRTLAQQSARGAAEAFAMTKAARLGYEALRHRLDPRYGRTMHRLIVIAAGAAAAGLLLAALHSAGSAVLRWPGWHPVWVSILMVLVILILVTTATEIITRTEPTSLVLARRRWHRAWDGYLAAVRVERSDAEAAAVAAQEWCSLIDIYATAHAASAVGTGGPAAGSPPAGNGHITPDPWPGASPM